MAYISTEEVKVIREELKMNFPSRLGWKLSIVRRDYLSLSISIIQAPFELRNDQNNSYEQVNQYWIERKSIGEMMKGNLTQALQQVFAE